MVDARTLDDTALPDKAVTDANSTAAEVDRSGFNPRGRLNAAGKGGAAAVALGIGFLAVVAFAITGEQTPKKSPEQAEESFKLTSDADAEKSARQAAAVVVTPDQKPPQAITIGQDPLGNPPIGTNPQELALAPEGQVPALTGPPTVNEAIQRRDRERLERRQALEREQARQDAMRRAPVMALQGQSASSRPSGGAASGNDLNEQASDAGNNRSGGAGNELQQRLAGIDIAQVRARKLPNRNFLVTAGAQIPCVLQTALDSTQPGLTSCVVPSDVWSNNGAVVVMEKGTRVLGEYQGGLSNGEYRIFVLWNRAVTPSGISVALASPAADQLGRAGVPGQVDNFFLQRFGSGLLLSIVGDAGAALSDRISNAQETSRAPNSAAALAVQDGTRIRPRLRASQGQEMTIMVARDVDFSDVYSLRLKR